MTERPEFENHRRDFVMEMYRVYWANMARSMEGIWKVLAPITVVGTILAGVHKDYLPASLGIAIAFVVILWAINVTIDLNAWHRRNLFFVVKAEREFLSDQDYGRILPASYKKPDKGWITFYKINFITFIAFLVLSIVYGVVWKLPDSSCIQRWLLPLIVLALGAIVTGLNVWEQEKSARSHFNELFGKKSESGHMARENMAARSAQESSYSRE